MLKIILFSILLGFAPSQVSSVQRSSANMFQVVLNDGTLMFVPQDPSNADYRTILAWQLQGHTPDPIATPKAYYDPVEAVQLRMKLSAISSELTSATTGTATLQAYQKAIVAKLVTLRVLPLLPAYTTNATPTVP